MGTTGTRHAAATDDGADASVVGLAEIEAAAAVIAGIAHRTPVVASATLSSQFGASILLKAENLQRTGSFKIRGALNKLASLGPDATGVSAGSAGNHAQAVALAAQQRGLPADIFVPAGAPISKIEACRRFGATVHEGGAGLAEAMTFAREFADAGGAVFCNPFDDPLVIAGQGTIGRELLADVDDLACVVVPLGGGGLIGGIATAIKLQRPEVRIVGVQAAVCAPYLGDPPADGPINTLADGIAVKHPGRLTAPIVERFVDELVTVDEDAIADAMVMLMGTAKLYVEGAGAVGVAALQSEVVTPPASGTTCVVLSGGNVDLGVVPSLIRRHETAAGRRLVIFARIDDRPGGLVRFLSVFAEAGANLIEVQHQRDGLDLRVRTTGVHATFEVRGPEHAAAVLAAARGNGFDDVVVETL